MRPQAAARVLQALLILRQALVALPDIAAALRPCTAALTAAIARSLASPALVSLAAEIGRVLRSDLSAHFYVPV